MPHPHAQQQVQRESSTYLSDPKAMRLCEVFREGLDSGLGYARIMNFLERKGIKSGLVHKLRTALLEDGMSLAETFMRYGILDESARKIIAVAEKQGALPEAFEAQIPIYKARYERKKDILSSLAEPVLLIYVAAFVLLPIMYNIIPLYQSEGTDFAALFMAIAGVVIGPAAFGMLCFFVLIGIGWAWLQAPVDSNMRRVAAGIWMMIPLVSLPSRYSATSMFARYMGASIAGGMNVYDSLTLAVEASDDPRLPRDLDRALDLLKQGETFEAALSAMRGVPEDVLDYVGLGEETGRLEEMLAKAADVFAERAEGAFEKFMGMFTFALRLVLIIGVILVAMLGVVKQLSEQFDEAMNMSSLGLLVVAYHIRRMRCALTSKSR